MKKTISFDVIQAKTLDPFTVDGIRNLHYHFFELQDGEWNFLWITPETDVGWLTQRINEGAIFIFE